MGWQAHLLLDLRREGERCVAAFEHEGPLRILRTLYPEGDGICHNVLVHPPGGLVGGDQVDVQVRVGPGAHGLLTTPGASRFYRSEGDAAVQRTRIDVAAGGRFEWLPSEAICYSGCLAQNLLHLELEPGAEAMAWDVCALGLPEAGQPFTAGSVLQQLAVGEHWLERGRLDAGQPRLMDGPLGLAGRRCLATFVLAAGAPIDAARRQSALDLAREVLAAHPLAADAAATSPAERVVVVRVLAPLVEPAMDLLRLVRDAWRPALWSLPATRPRLWST